MKTADTMDIKVTDASGQRRFTRVVHQDESVKEIIEALIAESSFTRIDSQGRPLTYQARLEREGRHLHASEIARDALQHGDRLVLTPNIDAGLGLN